MPVLASVVGVLGGGAACVGGTCVCACAGEVVAGAALAGGGTRLPVVSMTAVPFTRFTAGVFGFATGFGGSISTSPHGESGGDVSSEGEA